MIRVRLQVGQETKRLMERLKPQALRDFMAKQAVHMVAQARKNILQAGTQASTAWPPLSKPYARRKRLGKTPGAGKNRYAMLRDTGSMYEGLAAEVTVTGSRVRAELTSEGRISGRPSNAELLRIHTLGLGRVPARSPVLNMSLLEKRIGEALARHLSGQTAATG